MIHNKNNNLPNKVFTTFINFSEVFRPRLCECGEQFIIFFASKKMSQFIIDRFSPFDVTITISDYNFKEYNYVISK